MVYTPDIDSNLQQCVRKVCGKNAADPCNDEQMEVKNYLLVNYSASVEYCCLTASGRREQLQKSDTRVSPNLVEKVADGGFTASEQPGCVECPACKKQVNVNAIDLDLLEKHSPSCPYPYLCSPNVSRDLLQRDHFNPLLEHLRVEWLSTKGVVAREMEFHHCLILIALANCYIRSGTKFRNAGELVESLMDMEDPDLRPPVLWNVSPIVNTFELADKRHLRQSASDFVPKRLDEEAGNRKVERPRAMENSPQSSLEAPKVQSNLEIKTRKETLIEETLQLIYRWRCKSCGKNDADQLLSACGHLSLCSSCLQRRTCCPVCDHHITDSVRVYVS